MSLPIWANAPLSGAIIPILMGPWARDSPVASASMVTQSTDTNGVEANLMDGSSRSRSSTDAPGRHEHTASATTSQPRRRDDSRERRDAYFPLSRTSSYGAENE